MLEGWTQVGPPGNDLRQSGGWRRGPRSPATNRAANGAAHDSGERRSPGIRDRHGPPQADCAKNACAVKRHHVLAG